ncbi:MAG: 4-alpha-glucanotransferase [Chloroflexota bacterium]|nr:4-alpha-glucanotransferase [Chloroflexota bacterium]
MNASERQALKTSERQSGILCHLTCMPSRFGIGDMGAGVRQFLDFLQDAGQTLWQILPLGPTGYGNSPYQPFSAFAGSPLLIDLEQLVTEGLLNEDDFAPSFSLPADEVLYDKVREFKDLALRRSYQNFLDSRSESLKRAQKAFEERNDFWLEDFGLFMALKRHFDDAVWTDWDRDIALREHRALAYWRERLNKEVDYQKYLQFLFDRQWRRVRAYAHERGIEILGDVPIFVGHDSADVWSHRELFRLDEDGSPTVVAGVPPDYFSPTGQLWGNPHYRWDVMRGNSYAWWASRLASTFSRVDKIRMDHFRGFAGYWEIPADAETAASGRWVRGPGAHFFQTLKEELGELPIIAEDLGVITKDVEELRKAFGFPGMKVLQFAFGSDATNTALPHNYVPNMVAYTGTHDNDTSLGWYDSLDEETKHKVRVYTGTDGSNINWTLMRLAMISVAKIVIFPLQDVLGLGTEARLNVPGKPQGNWTWRYRAENLDEGIAETLRELSAASGRWINGKEEERRRLFPEISYAEP